MNQFSGLRYIFQPGELNIRPRYPIPGFVPQYRYLITDEDYNEVMDDLDSVEYVSFDTETTSLQIDELIMVSFSFAYHDKIWVCLVNHVEETYCFTNYDRLKALVWKILTRSVPFLFNSRFDLRVAEKAVALEPLRTRPVDVQSLIFFADTNMKMPALKPMTKLFLGFEPPELPAEWLGLAMQSAPLEKFGLYSAYDAYDTLQLGLMFYFEVTSHYPLIAKLDREFLPELMWYEDSEFDISRDHLISVQQESTARMAELQGMIYDEVGPFLLTSNQQLSKIIQGLGYDTKVLTKKGEKAVRAGLPYLPAYMSVAVGALENLEGVEFVKWVIEFKKLAKLNNSYLQPMLRRLDLGLPFRFHYIVNNAPTMRLAAGAYNKSTKKAEHQKHYFTDINFQSISKPAVMNRRVDWDSSTLDIDFNEQGKYFVETGNPKLNLRKAFTLPSSDWLYVPIDYSGQELKIVTNLSLEPVWIDAFLNGKDVHKETAVKLWGIDNYNKALRKKAKIANFLVIYGGGYKALMSKLHLTEHEAKEFIAQYEAALPTLFRWIERVHKTARSNGYIITPYNVARRLKFYYMQGGKGPSGFADRSAVNTMVQGSAGVIIRIAMNRLFRRIGPKINDFMKSDFYGDVKFKGTIHDELDNAIKKKRFREYLETVVPLMVDTTPKNWPVPMGVEVSVGNNWGETFPINYKDPNLRPIEVEEAEQGLGKAEDVFIDEFDDEDFDSEVAYGGATA